MQMWWWLSMLALVVTACGGAQASAGRGEGGVARAIGSGDEEAASSSPSAGASGLAARGGHAGDEDAGDEDGGDDDMAVEGLAGHIDPYDVEQGVAPHSEALAACYHDGVRRLRFADGKVEIGFTVGHDGAVKAVRMTSSTLGVWAIERCLLGVARRITFATPRGRGDATFTVPLDFSSGRSRARWLGEAQGEAEVEPYVAELDGCPGEPTQVWITMYVGPRGKVASVGFASKGPSQLSDAWIDCAREHVLGWQMTDPRGHIAKLAFRYNAR